MAWNSIGLLPASEEGDEEGAENVEVKQEQVGHEVEPTTVDIVAMAGMGHNGGPPLNDNDELEEDGADDDAGTED